MSRKKINKENENKDARFRRIANPRIKKILYELERLIKMTSQPNYTIYDVDAQKILDATTPKFDEFVTLYQKLASGESLKVQSKKEIKDIF